MSTRPQTPQTPSPPRRDALPSLKELARQVANGGPVLAQRIVATPPRQVSFDSAL